MRLRATYLLRTSSNTFHFRINVPADLRAYLGCREIKRTLRTTNPAKARVLAYGAAIKVQEAFERIREMGKRPDNEPTAGLVSFFTPAGNRIDVERQDPAEEARVAGAMLAELEGAAKVAPSPKPAATLISAVLEAYSDEKLREGSWTEKTRHENAAIYALLLAIVGDIPIDHVTHQTARDYKAMLQKLPPNMNKNPRYRDKSIEQILALKPEKVLGVATLNKHLSRVSSLFDWAARHGYVEKNCFVGLSLKQTVRANEQRHAFSDEDLVKIFASKGYREHTFLRPYYYWLPLLGLFTGARLNELCQLHLDDIREVDGVWVIDINDKDEKKLKTPSSRRLVPIHHVLIDLGLLRYAEKSRAKGHDRLFPELQLGRDGYGTAASKWFARYRGSIGVLHRGKDFHSFRHTFANTLKQAGIPREMVAALQGHSTNSITYERYGKPYEPKTLLPVVEHITFDTVLVDVKPY